MTTPVTLLTGVDPHAMATTMVGLLWDMPRAVAVRHHIDVSRQVLTRMVSDANGVVEHEEIDLAHACVTCAIREDIVPTLARVARDGRWASVLSQLPVGAAADQVCAVVGADRALADALRVSSVVTSLRGNSVVDDLLGDALLCEKGLESSGEDRRGVGEVACAMVEYADVVVLDGAASPTAVDLVRTLSRPDAQTVEQAERLTAEDLASAHHVHRHTHAWVDPQRREPLAPPASSRVWTLDLRSELAFHPGRLLESLDSLGGGRHRSRGCFWLPTRPDTSLVWDGSGGQLSIGNGAPWGQRERMTRIVFTGVGVPPEILRGSFEKLLLGPRDSTASRLHGWAIGEDGFEPWLGPLRDVA